ncbi:MAG: DNA-processing protein DprA [Sneathiellaceae bacterium]
MTLKLAGTGGAGRAPAARAAAAPVRDADLVDWLRLTMADHVGPLTFWRLLRRFGSAGSALHALPDLQRRGGGAGTQLPSRDRAEDYIAAAVRQGIALLPGCDPAYPELLHQIADPPPVLHLAGRAALLSSPSVALVGARNASALGRRMAANLAGGLGAAGWTIVSGLARGIDAAAHEAALATGTVAVLAGGVDIPYPRENLALYRRIRAEGGLVASEMPLGVQPQARHFPRRNRLVSGLACGVVLVEAALRSGSLITARRALEQDREVFAVPGSPLDPRARGCNALIKDGAALVESAEDVLAALPEPGQVRRRLAERPAPVDGGEDEALPDLPDLPDLSVREDEGREAGLQARLLQLVGPDAVDVDLLVRELAVDSASIATLILELEVAGRLLRHPGNRVSRPCP